MHDLTDRRLADVAKTSPALVSWWKKFEAVAPHLADRVADTEVLIGDELPLPPELRTSSPMVSGEGDLAWFPSQQPSKTAFVRILTLCLWNVVDSRYDELAMGFIDRLLNQAVTSGDERMLRLAEMAAEAVGEEGSAALAQLGIYVHPPVAIPAHD